MEAEQLVAAFGVAAQRPRSASEASLDTIGFICKSRGFPVGLPGLEPGTSSLSEKHDTLPKISSAYKMPANAQILSVALFPPFQSIRLGCCTVAAQVLDPYWRILTTIPQRSRRSPGGCFSTLHYGARATGGSYPLRGIIGLLCTLDLETFLAVHKKAGDRA